MPTAPTLILITNCTATKRVAAGEPVLLRNWTGSVRQRFRWWQLAIERQVAMTTARNCYAGDSWNQIVAAEKATAIDAQLWVISAGLGLLSADESIPNYSATFVNGELDSVASDHAGKIQWWNLLAEWRREATGIGSITDLALKNPAATMVVALSSSYLRIFINDLISTRAALASPENLLIVSAGTRAIPALGSSLLPIDARFEHLVGGSRTTINARMLRHIVQGTRTRDIKASKVGTSLALLATKLAKPRMIERVPLDDKQVMAFIRKQLKLVERPSASALLRILRDKGFACEQKRFHQIYKASDLT